MFEKVNPSHPDKLADRIAGAIVDIAYKQHRAPRIAVEVLIGHDFATVIVESNVTITKKQVRDVVFRLTGIKKIKYIHVEQDIHLANNQVGHFRCGDNGIFKGVPITQEERNLTAVAKNLYSHIPYDGKYILDEKADRLIICQSNAPADEIKKYLFVKAEINPLGDWTGGPNVDSGATNRKLGSDMAGSVTGGGLHGKDLSKADVSINIYCFLKAQKDKRPFEISCAIGDDTIDGKPYGQIVCIAKEYIKACGGFEKFAEWGLIGGPDPAQFFDIL